MYIKLYLDFEKNENNVYFAKVKSEMPNLLETHTIINESDSVDLLLMLLPSMKMCEFRLLLEYSDEEGDMSMFISNSAQKIERRIYGVCAKKAFFKAVGYVNFANVYTKQEADEMEHTYPSNRVEQVLKDCNESENDDNSFMLYGHEYNVGEIKERDTDIGEVLQRGVKAFLNAIYGEPFDDEREDARILDVVGNTKSDKYDSVHNPHHYIAGNKYEPRKVIADWGLNFNLGNVVKYIERHDKKGNPSEDLCKAIQYIAFELEKYGVKTKLEFITEEK